MNNQKTHWDALHRKGKVDHYSDKPSSFAKEVLNIIKPTSRVLELGCGVGNDSLAFAEAGHNVISTDFSEVAINKNKKRFKSVPNLNFALLDISKEFKFADNQFDVVYSRLSLHYFTDNATKKIFQKIYRVLRIDGFLCFICKSVNDPLYGKGEETEKDMFQYKGHMRHFFSKEYARECLNGRFTVLSIKSGNEKFYGDKSAFVKVIAKSIK